MKTPPRLRPAPRGFAALRKRLAPLVLACPAVALAATAPAPDTPRAEPVTWTTQQDHRNMMEQLGITRLRPGPSGQPGATNAANYDPAQANPFPNLPELLTLRDGTRVTTPAQWWERRRPEIAEDLEREVVGRVPRNVPKVTWTVVSNITDGRVGDLAAHGRRVVGHVDNTACPAITVDIRMTVVTPAAVPGPVPVLMMFGGFGGDGLPRPAGTPAPTNRFPEFGGPFRDPPSTEQLLAAGWGYAVINPGSIQADNGAGLTRGIIGLVNRGQPRKPDDWGALRAWAWGAARGLDHLEADPAVDARRVGIEGVSRFGKAALVAMAFEPRFAVALVGSSGEGGAKLHRRNFGEAVENLTGPGQYHWMAGNFLKYGAAEAAFGSRNAGDLPVDAHMLIALCAPRPTFISYGIPERGDALWLDQQGSFMAAVAAGEAFRLLGAGDLGVKEDYRTALMPPVNTGLLDGALAWRQHDGGHEDRSNMRHFIAWASRRPGHTPPATGASRSADFDLLIRHGRVADGTGNPARFADVAVKDGRITAVGRINGTARTVIDARDCVVAPGFIDVHTHADEIAGQPLAENFIRMGVTTVVAGNCGGSPLEVAAALRAIEATGTALNFATLIGHNTVREAAMARPFDREPTAEELARMRSLVAQGMRDGAVGLSTGLIYQPGTFARTEEIIELAREAAAWDGIYATHMRNEGRRIFDSLDEVFRIAREAGIRAQISHLKLAGPVAWGQADAVLAAIERARADGLDITHDVYAYTASSTGLSQLIPDWAVEGGRAAFRQRLDDPATKARIVAGMREILARSGRTNYAYAVIASCGHDRSLNGLSVVEATRRQRGREALDDQVELVLEIHRNGGATGVFHGIHEDDLQAFLRHPHTMVACDSGLRKFGEGVPHPRGYGNNARVLGRYVRDLKLLRLEDAVRRMTSHPAATFRFRDRGVIREGAWADLVVFDPARVRDRSTYDDPHHYPEGIPHVLVNGVPVVRDGVVTGTRPGVVLRHPAPYSGISAKQAQRNPRFGATTPG